MTALLEEPMLQGGGRCWPSNTCSSRHARPQLARLLAKHRPTALPFRGTRLSFFCTPGDDAPLPSNSTMSAMVTLPGAGAGAAPAKHAKPEVLAPAGGWPQLIAAVENGADAVYLGERACRRWPLHVPLRCTSHPL